jgi:hypothetical protein
LPKLVFGDEFWSLWSMLAAIPGCIVFGGMVQRRVERMLAIAIKK